MRVEACLSCTILAIALGACADAEGFSSPFNPGRQPFTPTVPASAANAPTNDGDRYVNAGTNPFVLTDYDPFSTFGADVDTASYDIFRRDVNLGMMPQPDSVRLEDYINAFRYDYPDAQSATPLGLSLAAVQHPFGRDTALLRVSIQANGSSLAQSEVPANVVFLIDTSGSMLTADKLPLVKSVLKHTLDVLKPTDRISIVTYAGRAGVQLPSTPVAQSARIESVVDGLEAGGSTAGAGGIRLAYEQARVGYLEGGINHVILCTDGDFNVGVSSDSELVHLIAQERASGVTMTALGFGIGNLNDGMMEKVSNAGNGSYAVISSEQNARRYVEARMLSALQLVAKDVKIQVEFNPERVRAYRLLGYEDRVLADDAFRDDSVDAGEIGAGMQVTALYELALGATSIPQPARAPAPLEGASVGGLREASGSDLAVVKLRYKHHGDSDSEPVLETTAHLAAAAAIDAERSQDSDFAWASAIAAFAELVKDSPFADPAALPTLDAVFHAAAELDPDRAEFVQLFDRWKRLR